MSNSVLLTVGWALLAVLATVMLAIGRRRSRAMRRVDERCCELRHRSLHDPLTGLPNRALVIECTERLLFRNQGRTATSAVLHLDLDDFKKVNHALGHAAGDQLLVDVAARLTSTLREAHTIGRIGGDEFVVLIDGAANSMNADVAAQRVLDAMKQPFDITGAPGPLRMGVSIGVATSHLATAAELLRNADVALCRAKDAGRKRSVRFAPDMRTTIIRRLELETDLRTAADNNQFRLAYQPIFRLDDLRLVSVEALLRWDHPFLGVIEPDEFIPILEQTGQIQDVGRWVLSRACQQMAQWRRQGDHVDMSVNVSAGRRDHHIDAVEGARQDAGPTGPRHGPDHAGRGCRDDRPDEPPSSRKRQGGPGLPALPTVGRLGAREADPGSGSRARTESPVTAP